MGYRVVNGKLHLIEDFKPKITNTTAQRKPEISFEDCLKEKIKRDESFTISNHAAERLKTRNISFDEKDMKSINEGINKAEEKGCKDCLIFYKNTALITSIKNRTVITAVDGETNKGAVFTNIDGVVIL